MRTARALCLGILGLLATRLLAQTGCPNDGAARAAAKIATERQAELLKVRENPDDLNIAVALPLQAQIRAYKDALTTAVAAQMACIPAGASAQEIQTSLAQLLNANLPEKPFKPYGSGDPDDQVYGADLKVNVSTPSNAQQMRAVEIRFDIECGHDTALLLYEAKQNGWQPVIRWQSGDYDEISGAFGGLFHYSIVPGNGNDSMRLVVAHGTDWCTSRFSNFKIDVLAPTAGTTTPRVIWHTERSLSRGDYEDRMRATSDGFELRVNAPALDLNGYERNVIYRYRIQGDDVTRVGPIAANGRAFVEEWLEMPWDEARDVTRPEAIPTLKAFHESWQEMDKKSGTYVSYEYGPVRACMDKRRYEVEMDADSGGPQFFAIQEGKDGYVMAGISTKHDLSCSGPDLMKKR
jgi:hypothetical protein